MFLDALGESNKISREIYEKQRKDFMQRAKRFGDTHKNAKFRILQRCEPNTDDNINLVVENRSAEWNAYEVHVFYVNYKIKVMTKSVDNIT